MIRSLALLCFLDCFSCLIGSNGWGCVFCPSWVLVQGVVSGFGVCRPVFLFFFYFEKTTWQFHSFLADWTKKWNIACIDKEFSIVGKYTYLFNFLWAVFFQVRMGDLCICRHLEDSTTFRSFYLDLSQYFQTQGPAAPFTYLKSLPLTLGVQQCRVIVLGMFVTPLWLNLFRICWTDNIFSVILRIYTRFP